MAPQLTIVQAETLLKDICKRDYEMCAFITYLVQLKKSGKLLLYYSQGDIEEILRTPVAGNVTMGAMINQLSCDPLECAIIFGACIC